MPVEIRVPMLGEAVVEATVRRWLKREGEPVAAGEPVVELETEKVSVEVPADRPGVVERIDKREGETVHPGEVLGVLGEAPAAVPPPAPAPAERPTEAPAVERARATPVAERLAAELGVDLARVAGTGPGGQITKEDVLAYQQRQAAPPPAPAPEAPPPAAAPPPPVPTGRPETRQRLSRRRLTIARHLVEALRTAAMLTTFNEIDMTAVQELRRRRRQAFRERHGVDLGLMPFFVRAVVAALKAFPQLNAELQGEELVLKHYYDIGIAVADPEGLVVPVLRDADRKSFAEIEREIEGFVERTRAGALTLEELRGGTFTITNGGVFGSLLSTPILNAPQVGILGMHKIQDRPVAVDGQVVVRPMMYVALSYDHRVVDGREAVLFLVRLKELIEDPEQLLLDG
ncbi:MAG TPA: 2-oxoglutarate dehydrogenase complex dihydrolipoyllysine-residue succinyltransferase [Chloroflexota bacterium]